jgi:hypothetical protein
MADGRSHIQLHQREGDGKNPSRSQWVLARAPPFPAYVHVLESSPMLSRFENGPFTDRRDAMQERPS